jgi:hypothetical protein
MVAPRERSVGCGDRLVIASRLDAEDRVGVSERAVSQPSVLRCGRRSSVPRRALPNRSLSRRLVLDGSDSRGRRRR